MRKVTGFTIIELVVVITILGILAAVALPKFFDIKIDAQKAAAQGVAGAIASGSALNYSHYLAKGSTVTTGAFTDTSCSSTDAAGVKNLLSGSFPTGYTVTGTPSATIGESTVCSVIAMDGSSQVAGTTADAVVITVK